MAIMLAAFVAVVPFATVRLPGNSGFIPIVQAILFIADLITAVLIYTMHFVVRSRALLVLASGYLFSAIFLIPHTLTFPNVFAPEGLLGPALQTTGWLYVISHFAFPASVIGYVALSDRTASEKKPQSFRSLRHYLQRRNSYCFGLRNHLGLAGSRRQVAAHLSRPQDLCSACALCRSFRRTRMRNSNISALGSPKIGSRPMANDCDIRDTLGTGNATIRCGSL